MKWPEQIDRCFPFGRSAILNERCNMTEQTLVIKKPDDWHLHLRDGDMLKSVLPETTPHFARAIIMPNLVPPVATKADAIAYRQRILDARPDGSDFDPLMTLYLTEGTDPSDLADSFNSGTTLAAKLYPAGATTNSENGVRDFENIMPVLEKMAEIGMVLCIHGEVTDHNIDIFDREKVFIDRVLDPLRKRLPELKVTMEHITTKDAVDYVTSSQGQLGASITTHHLMINRNAILVGGIKPHYYCLPVAKRENHRLALRKAATSTDERFFLGTDSAPHLDAAKIDVCGCAGIFTATNTMACLAQVFDDENALDRLEAFSSLNGPKHYGLDANSETITLTKNIQETSFPSSIPTPDGDVTVFDPMTPIYWDVTSS
jgi:dihydroorotase